MRVAAIAIIMLVTMPALSQDLIWKNVPAEYDFIPIKDIAGQTPTSVTWGDSSVGRWRIKIEGIGEPDADGLSTVACITAKGPSGKRSSLVVPSTGERNYLPILISSGQLDTVSKTTIGKWDIWQIVFEPMTCGDPPYFYLWVIRHIPTKAITVQAGVGRSLVAVNDNDRELDLLFLTQDGIGSTKKLKHYYVKAEKGGLSRTEKYPIDIMWHVDAPSPLVLSDDNNSSALRCLSWVPISYNNEGGVALPLDKIPSTGWRWVNNVPQYVDHYSFYDLHEPPMYAAISVEKRSFKWAESVLVLNDPLGSPSGEETTISIEDAIDRLSKGKWALVMDRRASEDLTAYGILRTQYE